jgi:hypothetical protein
MYGGSLINLTHDKAKPGANQGRQLTGLSIKTYQDRRNAEELVFSGIVV